ncbi:MAG: peptidylprolyl isomerase [Deinococcota bacterium]
MNAFSNIFLRIFPVVSVVFLLLAGGFWLSREPAPVATSMLVSQVADVTLPDGLDVTIPEGFVPSAYLSETQQQAFDAPEDVLVEGTDYVALMITNKGSMLIDLFEEQTPETVNSFVFLGRNQYYDGIVFHRVLEDFMAQTGDPTGTGTGGPGYEFDDEIVEGLSHDGKGVLSMANSGPGTNGSQFFLTFVETPWLDGRHTVFGEVIEGEAVLDDIQRIDPNQPSAIVSPTDTLADLAEQGVELAGEPDQTVEAYLETSLGAAPDIGQTFDIDGITGVAGRIGEDAAYGFYGQPDFIEALYILERPASN